MTSNQSAFAASRGSTTTILFAVLALLASVLASALAAEPADAQTAGVPADIVFIIDESGSMGPDIAEVQANVNTIATALQTAGLDAQFGLVEFGGTSTAPGNPGITTQLTDETSFSTALASLFANGSLEQGFDATELGMSDAMNFRQGAGVCAVLITDEDADSGSSTQQDAIDALNSRGATFFGIVNPTQGSTSIQYGPSTGSLADATGGAVFNILDFRDNSQPVLTALLNGCVTSIIEGINLTPTTAENPTGTDHTVTATVTDNFGNPIMGVTVDFEVVSGPNAGDTGMASTDANGEATFTYTGDGGAGTDVISASFTDQDGQLQTARAQKVWIATKATINVVKVVDSEPDGVFDDDPSNWTFVVRQAGVVGDIDTQTTTSDGTLTFEVDAGDDYKLKETDGATGLWLSSWSCVDDKTGADIDDGSGVFPPNRGPGDLDLAADQSVTCTFENQLLAGFMTGGGQITDDNDGDLKKKKDHDWISFGGNVGISLAGDLHGQWQANLHNVSDNTLDKGRFHSTSIDFVIFRDIDSLEDPAPPEALYNFIRFDATGRFNGEDGWSVRVRATDTGEPASGANSGEDADSIRIQLFDPWDVLVYDSLTDFPAQQANRHELDHGNLQIHPAE